MAQLIDDVLGRSPGLVTPITHPVYADAEAKARRRLADRDEAAVIA